ncbi:MAG TPA: hypothetical protein VII50_12255 [Acidothermaceae bacterium]
MAVGDKPLERTADHLGNRVAEQFGDSTVGEREHPIDIDGADAFIGRFDDAAIAFLALAKR